jgi:hypothetical protein
MMPLSTAHVRLSRIARMLNGVLANTRHRAYYSIRAAVQPRRTKHVGVVETCAGRPRRSKLSLSTSASIISEPLSSPTARAA